jgi:hypothetical protein
MKNAKPSGMKTVDQLKNQLDPVPEVRHLRSQVSKLQGIIDGMKEEDGKLDILLDDVRSEVQRITPGKIIPYKFNPQKVGPVSLVEHFTDIHYGAIQLASEIENFGEYSPEISKERVDRFGGKVIDWTATLRNSYNIDELVVFITGDLISGDIQRLEVTNAFPCPVQSVNVAYVLAEVLAKQACHFPKVRVEFICVDNHARLTQKPQSREAGLNNWNYVIGNLMKEILKRVSNIEFNIYPMVQKSVDVKGHRFLIMHGNGIQGWGGIPYYGIERRTAKEAVKRMNLADEYKFSKIVLGHFHAPLNHPYFLIGGSVSGTEAYDHSEGRHSPPMQTAWLVHPKYGETDWSRFYL